MSLLILSLGQIINTASLNKNQKAEQIVGELFNNYPQLNNLDMEARMEKRKALLSRAKENLIDKTGESDWNVVEVYKSLEMTLKSQDDLS